jgi:hypothetical protein
MKFEGDVAAFEAACLNEIRDSLEQCDRRGLSFRTLVAVELEGTYPDTAVVVTYRYKAENEPIPEDLRASFAIWSQLWFKPFEGDEMWSEAGEREAFIWFIGP